MSDEYRYPCTIIADRYRGSYSGGSWTAWPMYAWEIPQEHDGGDCECGEFWETNPIVGGVGRGETPEKAIADMVRRAGHFGGIARRVQ